MDEVKRSPIQRTNHCVANQPPEPARPHTSHPRAFRLSLDRPSPRDWSPQPLPLRSWGPPEVPRSNATRDVFGQIRNRIVRFGHRSARVVPEHNPDTPPSGPAVEVRFHSALPPRHPEPAVKTGGDEPVQPDNSPGRQSVDEEDEGHLLHTATVRYRDPIEDRIGELRAHRSWLVQGRNDWSWKPGDSFQNHTVFGVLVNLRMAAGPLPESSATRLGRIERLNDELARVDRELRALEAGRHLEDIR